MGTTTLIGPALGRKDIELARHYSTQFFMLLLIYCAIIPCIILPLRKQIATGLGATGITYDYLVDYIIIMFSGGVICYSTNVGLAPLLRQENKSRITMILMLISSVLNVLLDAIFFVFFIDELKMMAAALSTLLSQLVIDIYIIYAFCGGVKSMILTYRWKFCRFTKEYLTVVA